MKGASQVMAEIKELKERKKEFKTGVDGIVVNRVYTPADLPDGEQDLSLPGEYPFTRNIMPTGYRTRLWTCLLYTSPSPRDLSTARMPSSA